MAHEIWTAAEIQRSNVATELKDGRWVPSRPLTFWSLWPRIKAAWGVFTARYDALDWEQIR